MEQYGDGSKAIKSYKIADTYIDVVFSNGRKYRYSVSSAGQEHVDRMKELAEAGEGLTSYINQYTKNMFEPTQGGNE